VAQLKWLAWLEAASVPRDAPLPLFPLHIESMPSAMADQPRLEIIKDNPIVNGLDAFHASFNTVCSDRTISRIPDALGLTKKVRQSGFV
jgi:hypothetical protein